MNAISPARFVAPAPSPARPAASWSTSAWAMALAALVAFTVLLRARYFGNPLIDVDEEFYLLVGDRLLHGAVPYLDIWDRKPVGLFLLYAAMRALGGTGIVQYQLVASAFAAATAVVIAVLARRISTPGAALVAAASYAPALAMNGGAGGQTPVFYNLPMALAAVLVAGLVARPHSPAALRWRGAGAMLLVGLALQIKYSAVFEGLYFGLALCWLGWRARGVRPMLALDALLWAGTALLPTALAFGWYAAHGWGQAFVYANFTSIGAREAVAFGHQAHDLTRIIIRLLPFALTIAVGEWLLREFGRPWLTRAGGTATYRFLLGWLAAAVLGFVAFGTFFNHYALPLLVPLAIVAAPTFAIRYRGAGVVMGALVLALMLGFYPVDARKYERRRGDAAYAARLAAVIAPRLHGRCPYIFYGEPILYQLTDACLPTRWAFPFHLSLRREAPALGVDPLAEVRRIMAARPPVVVDRLTDDDEVNPVTQAEVRRDLARDYVLVFAYRHPDGADAATDQVWALRR